jgi:AcrR family transcriptional regulator
MDGSTRRTRGLQRGPRSQQVVEKVREATMTELARVGFPGLTIEGVAEAANVNRTTIYRRWPSKDALLLAVLEPRLQRFDQDPATGSLDGDLLALMLIIGETPALSEWQAWLAGCGASSTLRPICSFPTCRARWPSSCCRSVLIPDSESLTRRNPTSAVEVLGELTVSVKDATLARAEPRTRSQHFGRVSAAFRVSSNLNPCAVFWSD